MAEVDLARAAFHDAEYNLSVSQCLAMEPSMYLDYADTLGQCGRVVDSLDVFSLCTRYSLVSVDRLRHVINTFMDMLTASAPQKTSAAFGFGCAACESVLVQPVTLGCGHTFCAACVLRMCRCRECDAPIDPGMETNVLIKKVVEKWFQTELKAAKLREEGNRLCQINRFEEAVAKYNAALDLGE